MNRITKAGNELFKAMTLPIRMCVGLYRAVMKETPKTMEFPFEIKLKGKDNGKRSENTETKSE